MDIEELKMILDVVKSTGEGAFSLAIIYFVRGFLQFILTTGTIIFCLIILKNISIKLITSLSFGARIGEIFNRDICYESAREYIIQKASKLALEERKNNREE